jgi:hypothetical protein
MVRKPKQSPEVFTAYENFIYLLTELELVVEAGAIRWSPATVNSAKRRLEELAAKMHQVIRQIEDEKSDEGPHLDADQGGHASQPGCCALQTPRASEA